MTNYPPADTKAQWFQDDYPGATITPNVGVIHTTEGTGWDPYDGGAKAPNYTAKPKLDKDGAYLGLDWRAHFPDEKSSRALQNDPGGVETNTLGALQVELVGTCSPATHVSWMDDGVAHIFWPGAPLAALEDLAEFVAWCHQVHGIPLQDPDQGWLPYPASYGDTTAVRFTGPEWRNFYGWCGHQHVPENDHGDPGNLPWDRVARHAQRLLADDGDPGWEPIVLDLSRIQDAFRAYLDGDPQPAGTRRHVRRLEQLLNQKLATHFRLDGVVDQDLLTAWSQHELATGGKPRAEVPDMASLKALAGRRYKVRK